MLSPRLRLLVYLGGPREEGTRQGEMLRYFYAMWFRRIEDSGPVSKTERMRQTIGRPRSHSSTRRHNGYRCFITLNLGFWFRLWIFGQKPSTCSEIRNIDSLTYAPIRRYELSNPRRCKGCVLANIQIRSRPQLGHNLRTAPNLDVGKYATLTPARIGKLIASDWRVREGVNIPDFRTSRRFLTKYPQPEPKPQIQGDKTTITIVPTGA